VLLLAVADRGSASSASRSKPRSASQDILRAEPHHLAAVAHRVLARLGLPVVVVETLIAVPALLRSDRGVVTRSETMGLSPCSSPLCVARAFFEPDFKTDS
jgi:hypothetical protein